MLKLTLSRVGSFSLNYSENSRPRYDDETERGKEAPKRNFEEDKPSKVRINQGHLQSIKEVGFCQVLTSPGVRTSCSTVRGSRSIRIWWRCDHEDQRAVDYTSTPQCYHCATKEDTHRTDHLMGTIRCAVFSEVAPKRNLREPARWAKNLNQVDAEAWRSEPMGSGPEVMRKRFPVLCLARKEGLVYSPVFFG